MQAGSVQCEKHHSMLTFEVGVPYCPAQQGEHPELFVDKGARAADSKPAWGGPTVTAGLRAGPSWLAGWIPSLSAAGDCIFLSSCPFTEGPRKRFPTPDELL